MKLIGEIINELVDTNQQITSPLLKTKVLASRIRSTELAAWVNSELNGYSDKTKVPKYRRFVPLIKGSYISGNAHVKNTSIPIPNTDQEMYNKLSTLHMLDSISTLEKMAVEDKSGSISFTFPNLIIEWWDRELSKQNSYFQLLSVYQTVSISAVFEVISAVRNKLLDFMLKIDEEFGNVTEIESLQNKQQQITSILNQTIVKGDGNVVNTGDSSTIKASIHVTRGDKKALADVLISKGIEKSDLEELLGVIDSEEVDGDSFGSKTSKWIKKMLGKAVDGAWEVNIGAAGSLLADAIKAYYKG
ncbi:MAG: hypothetical protein JNL60_11310 [Bacteroidia bacterium]|nr:hypothetical protein [Bacteroidia bacterium]